MSDGLTAKQRLFVEHYLDCLNATKAAERAGYAKPRQQGSRLLTFVDVRAAVDEGLRQRAMGKDEIVARLAEHARGDMRDFLRLGDDGEPLWVELADEKPLHLIKEIEITKTTRQEPGNPDALLYDHKVKIKLYDAKSALDTLAKVSGLLKEGQGGVLLNVTPEQLAQMSDAEIEELARKRGML